MLCTMLCVHSIQTNILNNIHQRWLPVFNKFRTNVFSGKTIYTPTKCKGFDGSLFIYTLRHCCFSSLLLILSITFVPFPFYFLMVSHFSHPLFMPNIHLLIYHLTIIDAIHSDCPTRKIYRSIPFRLRVEIMQNAIRILYSM